MPRGWINSAFVSIFTNLEWNNPNLNYIIVSNCPYLCRQWRRPISALCSLKENNTNDIPACAALFSLAQPRDFSLLQHGR